MTSPNIYIARPVFKLRLFRGTTRPGGTVLATGTVFIGG